MKLGFEEEQTPFEGPTQKARFWTEAWVRSQVYCPNCGEPHIDKYENNRPVADFFCASCREEYELKAQKNKFGTKVLDGAFRTMLQRLDASNNPSLMLMNYDLKALSVTNLFVVPKHFFVPEIIEKRKPLAATARRAGWVGCNILLSGIPDAGKIFFVKNGQPLPKEGVLDKWRHTLFLRNEGTDARGWLIEVMKCVDLIGRSEFELSDVYVFEGRLSQLYPSNRHVKQKNSATITGATRPRISGFSRTWSLPLKITRVGTARARHPLARTTSGNVRPSHRHLEGRPGRRRSHRCEAGTDCHWSTAPVRHTNSDSNVGIRSGLGQFACQLPRCFCVSYVAACIDGKGEAE